MPSTDSRQFRQLLFGSVFPDNLSMPKVQKELAHQIWYHLDNDLSAKEIVSIVKVVEIRTIERYSAILHGFRDGKSNQELSTPEWDEDTIAERRSWWEDYERSKHGWSREVHLNSLAKSARLLRKKIINPELGFRVFKGKDSTWLLHDFDWRISPSWWLSIVAPSIDIISKSIPNHECLLSHLADSAFLKYYEELEAGAIALEKKWNEYCSRSGSLHADKRGKIIDTIDEFFIDGMNLVPGRALTKEQVDILKEGLSDYVGWIPVLIQEFQKYYPAFANDCRNLENLLQQAYDELDPDAISLDIEKGKCSRCS